MDLIINAITGVYAATCLIVFIVIMYAIHRAINGERQVCQWWTLSLQVRRDAKVFADSCLLVKAIMYPLIVTAVACLCAGWPLVLLIVSCDTKESCK